MALWFSQSLTEINTRRYKSKVRLAGKDDNLTAITGPTF
jgi:hypothetical protein